MCACAPRQAVNVLWGCTRAGSASETTGCVNERAQCFLREQSITLTHWGGDSCVNTDRNPGKGRGWMVNRDRTGPWVQHVAWGTHLPAGDSFMHFLYFQHELMADGAFIVSLHHLETAHCTLILGNVFTAIPHQTQIARASDPSQQAGLDDLRGFFRPKAFCETPGGQWGLCWLCLGSGLWSWCWSSTWFPFKGITQGWFANKIMIFSYFSGNDF